MSWPEIVVEEFLAAIVEFECCPLVGAPLVVTALKDLLTRIEQREANERLAPAMRELWPRAAERDALGMEAAE